jgi:peroxiredoxin
VERGLATDTSRAINSSEQESTGRTELSWPGSYVVTAGILLLLASVSLNMVLAHRLWSFTHLQSIGASERLLKVGTTVPSITAKGVDGRQQVISYQGTPQPTVLYVFTPPCSWCARNMDNFKALIDKQRGQYRFIGLSLSEGTLAEYIAKNELKLPIYSGLSPETLKTYKLGSTPQTIVISPEGRVLQNWMGAYVGAQKSQIEAFFRVSLPGLRTDTEREQVSQTATEGK